MPKRIPTYRFHRARQCAVVRIEGRDHYLGAWESPESRAKYDRLIAEYLANGRTLESVQPMDAGITVVELISLYWDHISAYYGPDNHEVANHRVTLRLLKSLYGDEPANAFGPTKLKAVREKLIDAGHARGYINQQVGRLKRMFRWGVAEELVGPEVHQRLQALEGLHRGRTRAAEGKEVEPVDDATIAATLPQLSRTVQDW